MQKIFLKTFETKVYNKLRRVVSKNTLCIVAYVLCDTLSLSCARSGSRIAKYAIQQPTSTNSHKTQYATMHNLRCSESDSKNRLRAKRTFLEIARRIQVRIKL